MATTRVLAAHVAAWLLSVSAVTAAVLSGCGPSKPFEPPPRPHQTFTSHETFPLYGDAMADRDDFANQRATNAIFLLRKKGDSVEFGRECGGFSVGYRWHPSRQSHTEDLFSNEDVSAKFPINPGFHFDGYFSSGKGVRIRLASPGSYHLEVGKVKLPLQCRAGHTHYVRSITVGAFAVSTFNTTKGGAGASVVGGAGVQANASEDRVSGTEAGKVFECDVDAPNGPPKECEQPIEVQIADINDLASSDDPNPVAGGTTSPPTPPKPEATCYEAVKLSGDPERDVLAVGEACGKVFGLKPIGAAFVRNLSEKDGWRKQYEFDFQKGACYRVLGVGDSGIHDLDVGIKNSKGEDLAVDGQHGPVAVVNPRGPYCAKVAETVVIYAKVEHGAGRYGLWIWKK
jgi:hypothetical protein